jgi:beta-lactamase class A
MRFFKIFCLTFLISLPQQLFAQGSEIENYLAQLPKSITVSYTAFGLEESRSSLSLNSDRIIPSASIIKLPILLTLIEAVEQNRLSLEDVYLLQETDIVGGAGELQYQKAGNTYSLDYLAREMIRLSDNTATNILIRTIGMEKINQKIEQLGYQETVLNRKMMDFDAIKEGKQNFTSTRNMADLLNKIYHREGISTTAKAYILDLLFACEDKQAIVAGLPGYQIAHKTGSLDYVRGDAGIVFAEKPVVLVVFVENFSSQEQADEIIAALSGLLFETLQLHE